MRNVDINTVNSLIIELPQVVTHYPYINASSAGKICISAFILIRTISLL
ncbi:hypothetical protein SCFA_3550003 [anaerobic digester metagenome]|jgi:hypothetical protein|uniref:Uncharacterized protein n=1 Tax=anaerobic digester metagenome TaxID=1263854 RepID=A0A485M4W6_9ZZZZ